MLTTAGAALAAASEMKYGDRQPLSGAEPAAGLRSAGLRPACEWARSDGTCSLSQLTKPSATGSVPPLLPCLLPFKAAACIAAPAPPASCCAAAACCCCSGCRASRSACAPMAAPPTSSATLPASRAPRGSDTGSASICRVPCRCWWKGCCCCGKTGCRGCPPVAVAAAAAPPPVLLLLWRANGSLDACSAVRHQFDHRRARERLDIWRETLGAPRRYPGLGRAPQLHEVVPVKAASCTELPGLSVGGAQRCQERAGEFNAE